MVDSIITPYFIRHRLQIPQFASVGNEEWHMTFLDVIFLDKLLVLLTPSGKTVLEVLRQRILLLAISQPQWGGGAATGVAEVVQMGKDVGDEAASIALDVGDALADADFGEIVDCLEGIPAREPVLRGDVPIAGEDGRKTGNRVVLVCDPPMPALLAGEPICKLGVTHAGGAICIQINWDTVAAEVGCANDCDGTPQGVTSYHNFIAGVLLASRLDGCRSSVLDLIPGLGETGMEFTLVCEIAAAPGEDDVGDVVANVITATDRKDDLLADRVDGYVGADPGKPATIGLCQDRNFIAVFEDMWKTQRLIRGVWIVYTRTYTMEAITTGLFCMTRGHVVSLHTMGSPTSVL